jgi:hypothetical protein
MSKTSWLVSGVVPGVERQPLKLEPDATALLRLIERWRLRPARPDCAKHMNDSTERLYTNECQQT